MRAEIKNFKFRGSLTKVNDSNHLLDNSVTNGVAFEGFYIFDTDIMDSNSDPTVGDYRHSESTFGIVVKVGSYVFRTNPRHVNFLIEVVNRTGGDVYLLRSYHNLCSQPLFVEHISWQLDDSTGSAVTNTALPAIPPDLAAYQSSFSMTVSGGGSNMAGMPYLIRGTVDSIEEAPAVTPERPPTALSEAVEVSWPSLLGYFYQIQISEDLDSWKDIGEPMLGDGTVLSRFFPMETGRRVFYKVDIANFSQ
ncbi:MAG: hypothetical protein KIT22_17170 [Verrucomicrobiae bacterium]|nr:hypothetical protein [Verrucomicrobiae bacterium]